jgi:hypothetical protein
MPIPTSTPAGEAEAEFWRVSVIRCWSRRWWSDAFAANQDLRAALARYEQARALHRQARFDRSPR